jgi:hypothetical protein
VEVKDPYAKNSIGDLSPDAVARHGAAGIAQLQTLGKSLDSVKDPLSELLAKLPDDNYDSGFNILSPDQLVQSVATAAGVDDAKKKMDAALGAATAGDPASIAAATDSVKAFRSAMDGAAQLVTNWQDDLGWGIRNFTASDGRGLNSGATGDKSYGVFSDIISQYQEAMRHAGGAAAGIRAGGEGLPVMANANAGAAPGAGNTIASAGSGVFSNSTLTAAAVLSSFSDKANSLAQQFGTLAASAAQLNPAFASLLQASNSSSLALPSSQSSNPLGGRNITNVNVGSVNVPPLDVREASSQIASKFVPILQQLSNQQRRQLESATQASLTLGGL